MMKKDLTIDSLKSHIEEEIEKTKTILSNPRKYHKVYAQNLTNRAFYGLKKYTEGQFDAYSLIFYLIKSLSDKTAEGV